MEIRQQFRKTFVDHHILSDINFHGHCLINDNISLPEKVIISLCLKKLNRDFPLNICLFGSVKLIKNADPDK